MNKPNKNISKMFHKHFFVYKRYLNFVLCILFFITIPNLQNQKEFEIILNHNLPNKKLSRVISEMRNAILEYFLQSLESADCHQP